MTAEHNHKELLEQDDMQGLIVRGYEKLPEATFFLLNISDDKKAKSYLQEIVDRISTAKHKPETTALHVAFTSSGLRNLQLPKHIVDTFQREFLEGMHDPVRAQILGDINENDPMKWGWGGANTSVDMMVMCYGHTINDHKTLCDEQLKLFSLHGLTVIKTQTTNRIPKAKEHFGFKDGISKPFIKGLREYAETEKPVINAGEFVLGYKNEYDNYTSSPFVAVNDDPDDILPVLDGSKTQKDLGKNGTYLIYRQIAQDVPAFWKYMKEHSKEPAPSSEESAIKLASKMVGRWPAGKPLVLSDDAIDTKDSSENVFGYWKEDPDGMKCPFGAHIRRANPRDLLLTERKRSTDTKLTEDNRDVSVEMVTKHQILRRGRLFGTPLQESMEPIDLMNAKDDGVQRGLHFICLAGHITRQFEFIMNAWIKSPVFGGLYKDADPFSTRQAEGAHKTDEFTCPAFPVRRKYKSMPQFTYLMGGAYFFLPGIKALRYLATR
jgi:Dyp-type peroxidase family